MRRSLLFLLLLACSSEVRPPAGPSLGLRVSATDTVDVVLDGPVNLAALQTRLHWEPSSADVRVTRGPDAAPLDLLMDGISVKPGAAVIGVADTRELLLPRAGVVLRLRVGPGGKVKLWLSDARAAAVGGKAVAIAADQTAVEVSP